MWPVIWSTTQSGSGFPNITTPYQLLQKELIISITWGSYLHVHYLSNSYLNIYFFIKKSHILAIARSSKRVFFGTLLFFYHLIESINVPDVGWVWKTRDWGSSKIVPTVRVISISLPEAMILQKSWDVTEGIMS